MRKWINSYLNTKGYYKIKQLTTEVTCVGCKTSFTDIRPNSNPYSVCKECLKEKYIMDEDGNILKLSVI